MYHIARPISCIAILAALITPTFSTTNPEYTYQDVGLSRPLKIYENLAIASHKLKDVVDDMSMMSDFLDERQTRVFFPFHPKHPLLIQGYLRRYRIKSVPKELIFVINNHIPNHRIQRSTYFFLPNPIINLISTIFNPFQDEDDYDLSDQDGDVNTYDKIDSTQEEQFLIRFSKRKPDAFKQTYAAYRTLKEFFISYDDEKKDYQKGFDCGLRHDAITQCETRSRKNLAKKDRIKQLLAVQLISLDELSRNKIQLLHFSKYSSTLQDIIDVINFANGAKVDKPCEIQKRYSTEHLEYFKSVPKKMNKNWTILPHDINFYDQYYHSFDKHPEYRLLDIHKPIALKSHDVASYMHPEGFIYFSIYFSAIPLIKHLLGGNH